MSSDNAPGSRAGRLWIPPESQTHAHAAGVLRPEVCGVAGVAAQ